MIDLEKFKREKRASADALRKKQDRAMATAMANAQKLVLTSSDLPVKETAEAKARLEELQCLADRASVSIHDLVFHITALRAGWADE